MLFRSTSDASKPVSTATSSALALKADLASPTFTGTVSGITKAMVGLGNCDNTSDANKPISTATQTALNAKADSLTTYTKTQVDTSLAAKADTLTTYSKTDVDTKLTSKVDSAYLTSNYYTSTQSDTQLALKANLASPAFTGTMTLNGTDVGASLLTYVDMSSVQTISGSKTFSG